MLNNYKFNVNFYNKNYIDIGRLYTKVSIELDSKTTIKDLNLITREKIYKKLRLDPEKYNIEVLREPFINKKLTI